jgi:hypothetical protein
MDIQAKVAIDKEKHPERFCAHPRCLWRVMKCDPMTRQMVPAPNCEGRHCPRHRPRAIEQPRTKSTVMDWIRNGFQFQRQRQ